MRPSTPRRIIRLALLLTMLFPWLSLAQTNLPAVYTITALAYTNALPDNTNYPIAGPVISAERSDLISWQFTYRLPDGAGTEPVTLHFARSLDNTNYPGTFLSQSLPAAGTNLVCTNFQMDLEGMRYVKMTGVTVGSNGFGPTNLLILYTPKTFLR